MAEERTFDPGEFLQEQSVRPFQVASEPLIDKLTVSG